MIVARADIAFVARQLGHATPATTLLVYTHLFDEAANIGRVHNYVNAQFPESVTGHLGPCEILTGGHR